jgi:methylated-DNA-[protein]-cysteine S-methyltransferase
VEEFVDASVLGSRVGGRRSRAQGHVDRARAEIEGYFRGRTKTFRVAYDLEGSGSEFQQEVWAALRAIPYGSVVTYGQVASSVGRPLASRAVGRAVGANPLPLIVPCHRVVGCDRRLVGFSSGLDLKVLLLRREGVEVSEGKVALASTGWALSRDLEASLGEAPGCARW